MPGRCGSPRKFAALPNRPAQVARLLSQPSPDLDEIAGRRREGRRLAQRQPAVRPSASTALSSPLFAPPSQRSRPQP